MRHARTLLVCLSATVVAIGCATPPPTPAPRPVTTVVLMPDEDGKVGAVTVTTSDGTQRIDTAYESTLVEGVHARPSALQLVGEGGVNATYRDVLGAQPSRPESFILYFINDSTALTPESKDRLPAVFRAIAGRKPTEITIFGYTDATGTEARNLRLSAARARAAESLIRKQDPTLGYIDVESFGDKAPLFPSAPNVPEPRNRRAEIMLL